MVSSTMYVFSYRAEPKLAFWIKRHDFLATPPSEQNTPRCADHNLGGKVQNMKE